VKGALESPTAPAEQPQTDAHPVAVARDLRGLFIGDRELRARLGISRSSFYQFKGEGRYDFLLASPQPTNVSTYCGTLVQKWLDGAGEPGRPRLVNGARRR
jgi:hypothetical protein